MRLPRRRDYPKSAISCSRPPQQKQRRNTSPFSQATTKHTTNQYCYAKRNSQPPQPPTPFPYPPPPTLPSPFISHPHPQRQQIPTPASHALLSCYPTQQKQDQVYISEEPTNYMTEIGEWEYCELQATMCCTEAGIWKRRCGVCNTTRHNCEETGELGLPHSVLLS